MKIGLFSESFLPVADGVGRVVYNSASSLGAAGNECYVMTPMSYAGYRGNLPFDIVDYPGAPVPGSPQYKTGLAILDRHYQKRMADIMLDIAHAHTPFIAGVEARRIANKQGCPLVATFHSRYYEDFYRLTGMEALAELGVSYLVHFYDKCDEVWTVSQHAVEELAGYGYTGPVFIMENGTEPAADDPKSAAMASAAFDLGDSLPVLLYVGQLDWKKNLLHIIEAASLLKLGGRQFLLVMAGQGKDRDEIVSKAEDFGVSDRLVLTGFVDDARLLDGLYRRALLLVFPSTYDTSSLVLREAAARGLPAVVTENSAPAEVVRHRENGLVAADTSIGLYNVIDGALSDPRGLAALGAAAKRTIPVGWDEITQKTLERYTLLIDMHGQHRAGGKDDRQKH